MKYIYPAIFNRSSEGGYEIIFPDFPHIHTEGETLTEAFDMAEDALNLWLWDAEEKGKEIPSPSDPSHLASSAHSFISLVKADTLEYRKYHDTKAIKKTLTIPRWLDTLAREKNINFSNLLQNALMSELKLRG